MFDKVREFIVERRATKMVVDEFKNSIEIIKANGGTLNITSDYLGFLTPSNRLLMRAGMMKISDYPMRRQIISTASIIQFMKYRKEAEALGMNEERGAFIAGAELCFLYSWLHFHEEPIQILGSEVYEKAFLTYLRRCEENPSGDLMELTEGLPWRELADERWVKGTSALAHWRQTNPLTWEGEGLAGV